ncbi:MAG: 30S ribosomal protein S3 [bacterium]|nr:30S ribosomal protein S3 [bacterium]
MTHTVHPYSFRIGILRGWRSRWFNSKKYKTLLKEDVLIREALTKKLRGMYIDSIEFERTQDILQLIIKTSRPGLVIGRKGEGVEGIKREVFKILKKHKMDAPRELKLTIEEIKRPETRAAIVAQIIAENLEKKLPFKRVMKQVMDKVMANKEVKGVKVALSGRLGGAEMSRSEWLSKGRMPLQTLKADIDFIRERAHLSYGDIGIKVWIYKEESNV